MKILVTNDDGIHAEGIKILVEFLKKRFLNGQNEIKVIAPSEEMSAVSQKLTLRNGLKITKENLYEDIDAYSVTGTPTDCVKVSIHHFEYIPDVVISGINKGYNTGYDILYSGTVSACFEAALNHIKGIALSVSYHSFEGTAYLNEIFDYLEKENYFVGAEVININIPEHVKEIKITKQGILPFDSKYIEKDDLYHLEGHPILEKALLDINSDVYAVNNEQVSISFLTTNRNDMKIYEKYKK